MGAVQGPRTEGAVAVGMFDSVYVPCPKCGKTHECQSKSGECLLDDYTLENAPADVLSNVNRHAPFTCEECGCSFDVVIATRSVRVLEGWEYW